MKQKNKSDITALLDYAGSHRRLTFLGLSLSALSMLLSMVPYLCIWLAARDLIAVAPNWTQAQSVARYGWLAFGTAFGESCCTSADSCVPTWRPSEQRPTSASVAWPM